MEPSSAARVLSGPCAPNHYPPWYGSPAAHQITHNPPQSPFLHHFHSGSGSAAQVLSSNQASGPMYNLHPQQYHQYHTVANSSTGTPPGMSMHHGFIGNPHHHSSAFSHPTASVGDPGSQLSAMAPGFPAFMLNMERSNDSKCLFLLI